MRSISTENQHYARHSHDGLVATKDHHGLNPCSCIIASPVLMKVLSLLLLQPQTDCAHASWSTGFFASRVLIFMHNRTSLVEQP
jgi:hypothetical protein